MRTTTRAALTAAAAGAVALTVLSLGHPATAAESGEKSELTAKVGQTCRDDGTTRVRVVAKNASRKDTGSVLYSWKVGASERTMTTSVDAPESKKLVAFTIPAGGTARVVVKLGPDFDETLLKRNLRALDC